MTSTTITTKGQVTIPKAIRDSLMLNAGDKIEFIVTGKREALIRPISKKVDEVFGILHKDSEKTVSVEEMNAGIRQKNQGDLPMIALDTNVIVRFLVRDDETQAQTVYQLFKQAEQRKQVFWVPLPVVLETLWVLDSVYAIPRQKILDAVSDLVRMPVLAFESAPALQRFIRSSRESTADLADILIACSAASAGCEHVLTFDKKACHFDLFKNIQQVAT